MNSQEDRNITSDTQGLKHVINEEHKVTRFAETKRPGYQDAKPSWAQGTAFYLNHPEAEAAKLTVRMASTIG